MREMRLEKKHRDKNGLEWNEIETSIYCMSKNNTHTHTHRLSRKHTFMSLRAIEWEMTFNIH